MISTEDLILERLVEFYQNDNNLQYVIQIIGQETNISLRLLDWLVTNYAKGSEHNDGFLYNKTGETKDGAELASDRFDVHTEYKNQLKAYNKKYFDPFARKDRIYFFKDHSKLPIKLNTTEQKEYKKRDDGLVTTIGQLNFFKWAIENKVIQKASAISSMIEADMLKSTGRNKELNKIIKEEPGPKRKTKRTLSKTNHHSRSSHKEVIVTF